MHSIAMVLRGDHAFRSTRTRFLDLYARLILTAVTKWQFVGFGPCRERQDLITETDAQNRYIEGQRTFHIADRWAAHVRVARSI